MTNDKQLKIFIDAHIFDHGFQGTTTYIRGLYLELIQYKEIRFFFAATDISNLEKAFGKADNIVYLSYRSKNKFLRLLIDIPRMIKKNKIDFAHFQYIVPPIKKCKYITTIHDVLFLDYPEYFPLSYKLRNKFLFKWSALHSDIVLTVSNYSKEQIQKHFGIKEIGITPNAVDPVFFETYDKIQLQETVKSKFGFENYWIFISRWEPRKNHNLLLKVFAENEFYKDNHLVFVGDKAIENEEFEDLYRSLKATVKSKITILNKVNFGDLLLLVRASRLSVYPSIAEGFGIPPLETAAAGIPTLCSNTTAMSDFDFFGDKLFSPFDEIELAKKIRNILQNGNYRPLANLIKNKYNWKNSALVFLEVLRK